MSNVNDLYAPACQAACADITLLNVSGACFSPSTLEESEIIGVYMSEPATASPKTPKNPITNWTNTGLAADADTNKTAVLAWIATVNNTSAGGLRYIEGIGDKPEPSTSEVTGPSGQIARISKTHILNFDILTVDNLNYEFLRKLDGCGGRVFIWYVTKQYIYGGMNGIEVNVTKAPHLLSRGAGSVGLNTIEFSWTATTDPARDFNQV